MITNPIVSIVIPMYNVSNYIGACLDSVFAQTFHNFEVICVNDGCTDDTMEKVNQYTDSRLCVVHQSNQGLSSARNTGIFASNGIYVAFLDSDDIWDERKLTLHVKHLTSNSDIAVSYSQSLFIDEQGVHLGLGQYPKLNDICIKDVLCRNPIGNGSAPVIRKATLIQHIRKNATTNKNEIFNESLRQSEDIELWLRIIIKSPRAFEGIEFPLTFYRVNATGLSANTNNQYKAWHLAIWQIAKQHNKTRTLFSLAKAYQLRYLARRAVYSRNPLRAIILMQKALLSNPKILLEEPRKTLLTVFSTFASVPLRLLPKKLYSGLYKTANVCLTMLRKKQVAV